MTDGIDGKKRLVSHTEGVRRRPFCWRGTSVLPLVRFSTVYVIQIEPGSYLLLRTSFQSLVNRQNQLPFFAAPCGLFVPTSTVVGQDQEPFVTLSEATRQMFPRCFIWSIYMYTSPYIQICMYAYSHTHNLIGNISIR